MLIDFLLVLLSVVGFLIALYFTLIYYQKIPVNYFLVPRVCRMEESTCQTVLSTPEARVLGVPNFLLGLIYYVLVSSMAFFGGNPTDSLALDFLLWVSFFVVILGLYLTYSLLFKIKIPCPLCFASHGINGLIALLLLLKSS